MYITPVSSTYTPYKFRKTKCEPAFTSVNMPLYSRTSCYFRRGAVILSSKGYDDIENLFYKIFNANKEIKNMLIIGVGRSQEPFSYLATIKGILNGRPLAKNVDLSTIDLQPLPSVKELKSQAMPNLFDYQDYPKFAKRSFVTDNADEWFDIPKSNMTAPLLLYQYKKTPVATVERINDEIFDFVKNIYNNPEKSLWNTPVQCVIGNYPNKKFDVISANNVLGYITSDKDYLHTYKNILRILKPKGYFITDPYPPDYVIMKSRILDNMKEIFKGIYQKMD